MKHKYFGIFMIVAEILAVGFLFLPGPFGALMIPFLIIHFGASILTILWVKASIPKAVLYQKRGNFYYLCVYCLMLPVIGTIIMVLRSEKMLSIDFLADLGKIKVVPQPYFESETIFAPTKFGEGGAISRLRSTKMSATKRIGALLAIDTCENRQRNKVIRDTLFDNEDEVRLLAFGLLEKQEKQITQQIRETKKRLDKEKNEYNRALNQKELAFCYWELVYQGLALDDLRNFAINMATELASDALKVLNDDIGLHLLFTKIYLATQDYSKAKEALEQTQALDAPYSKILPYLAELAYYKRDFNTLRSYLATDPDLLEIPTIGPVYQFWCSAA